MWANAQRDGCSAEYRWRRLFNAEKVWLTPTTRVSCSNAAKTLYGSQQNFARCLAVSWAGRLFLHFRRMLPRNGILPCAKFTLRPPSVALSYIGSITAWHSSSGRERNFVALSTRRHLHSAGRPSRWGYRPLSRRIWPPPNFVRSPKISRKKFGQADDGVSTPPPKKISPVKLNAFLITSSAQNNSATQR